MLCRGVISLSVVGTTARVDAEEARSLIDVEGSEGCVCSVGWVDVM